MFTSVRASVHSHVIVLLIFYKELLNMKKMSREKKLSVIMSLPILNQRATISVVLE